MTETLKQQIDAMIHEELVRVWRFAPVGDPRFAGEAGEYFKSRLKSLGGITPGISKKVGWDK